MQLVAGLGNPGPRYADTPHNLGFEVVDELARRWRAPWRTLTRWQADVARRPNADPPLRLVKPLSFMNLSGQPVASLLHFYGLTPRDLLVVVDDVNLPLGKIRLRADGTDGGHNGLRSIIQQLASTSFPRLRIGCAPADDDPRDRVAYVLGKWGRREREWTRRIVDAAADAVEDVLETTLEKAMSRHNRLAVAPPDTP